MLFILFTRQITSRYPSSSPCLRVVYPHPCPVLLSMPFLYWRTGGRVHLSQAAPAAPSSPPPFEPASVGLRNVHCTATFLDGTLQHPAIIEMARTRACACACCAACLLGVDLARLRSRLSVSQGGRDNICVPAPPFCTPPRNPGSWFVSALGFGIGSEAPRILPSSR
jgi:hypothetical protein